MPRSYPRGTFSTGEFVHHERHLEPRARKRGSKKYVALLIIVGPATGKKRIRA